PACRCRLVWTSSTAREVKSRCPCNHEEEEPLEELPPPPALKMMMLPPAPHESASVRKELPPRADSSKAEVKIASVLASVSCEKRCCSSACSDSVSKTLLVSRRSKTATRCCSPGASGSE